MATKHPSNVEKRKLSSNLGSLKKEKPTKHSKTESDETKILKNVSNSPRRRGLAYTISIFSLAFGFGCLHMYHVATMFENDRHFSHLSMLEREMTFRTEMGLYYSYYKTLIEATTFGEGLYQITNDNRTEYPSVINTLQRFNLYPEVVVGWLYRVYVLGMDWADWPSKQCWQVERGHGLMPVTSCEGLGDPTYFYLEMVWLCAGVTMALVFLYGTFLSNSVAGGFISVVCFFYNHGECTRVHWAPPLRESFAYPFILLQLLCITSCLRKNNAGATPLLQLLTICWSTWMVLVLWQFSQFVVATQVVAVYLMFVMGAIDKHTLLIILFGQALGVIQAAISMFGNELLLCSLLTSVLITTILIVLTLEPGLSLFNSMPRTTALLFLAMLGTITIKTRLSQALGNKDDSHIFNILKAKITNYRDFHTLLYTCSAEFDYLPPETFKKLSETLLLPTVAVALLAVLWKWIRNCIKGTKETIEESSHQLMNYVDAEVLYNILQLGAFTLMAVAIMRLKLFFTPQLCILASLLASRKYFRFLRSDEVHWAILAVLISGMSVRGFKNLNEQRNILGEYSNMPFEELLMWVKADTSPYAVFAGPMPIMANLLLSTRRPIVNHPHYEDAGLREKTKKVYSIFSRKSPQEVFKILSRLQVEYVVLEETWCFRESKKGCSMTDLWDVEDPVNINNPAVCPQLFIKSPPPFQRVFANENYVVLRLHSQYVEIKTIKEYKL